MKPSSSIILSATTTHEYHRGCASHEVHEQQLRENPELAIKCRKLKDLLKMQSLMED